MRHRFAVYTQRRQRLLPGLAETVLADCTWEPERWSARHTGRFAVRRGWLVEPLLCVLLVRHGGWWRCVRHGPEHMVRRGRHLFCVADYGGNPGAHQSEGGRSAG